MHHSIVNRKSVHRIDRNDTHWLFILWTGLEFGICVCEKMSSETSTQSQNCFLKAAHEFLEVQIVNHATNLHIEQLFIEIIAKGQEYRKNNKRLTEENDLLRRAVRKFHALAKTEHNKYVELQEETMSQNKSHSVMQRKLVNVRQKYQRLHQKLSAILREDEEEENNNVSDIVSS